jgi:hypothetical protein
MAASSSPKTSSPSSPSPRLREARPSAILAFTSRRRCARIRSAASSNRSASCTTSLADVYLPDLVCSCTNPARWGVRFTLILALCRLKISSNVYRILSEFPRTQERRGANICEARMAMRNRSALDLRGELPEDQRTVSRGFVFFFGKIVVASEAAENFRLPLQQVFKVASGRISSRVWDHGGENGRFFRQ